MSNNTYNLSVHGSFQHKDEEYFIEKLHNTTKNEIFKLKEIFT